MAEPNWEAWEQILRDLQGRMGRMESRLESVDTKLDTINTEVKGLKRMSQMALGTASGADFVAEKAERLAEQTSKRLDDLIAALKRKEIDVDA